jgi:hypothetical protein
VDARSAPCDLKDNGPIYARHKHTQAMVFRHPDIPTSFDVDMNACGIGTEIPHD